MNAKATAGYGYILSKQWFEFASKNEDITKPIHSAIWHWFIELNNRLKWQDNFSVPSYEAMRMTGIKNHKTYKKAFDNLVEWGFVKVVTKSTNQHTANVIALVKFTTADSKKYHSTALSTAHSTAHSTATILKQEETIQTVENPENPKEGSNDFFDFILSLFQEVYKEINNVSYVNDREKDYSAAVKLVDFYKSASGITDEEELKVSLKAYFEQVINHPDNFHRTRMTLPYLVNYINPINNGLKNTTKKGTTMNELRLILENKINHPNKEWDHSSDSENLNTTLQPIPPTLEEVEQFFEENAYKKEGAKAAFDTLAKYNWIGKNNDSVIPRWKETVKTYFFKPEYLSTPAT